MNKITKAGIKEGREATRKKMLPKLNRLDTSMHWQVQHP